MARRSKGTRRQASAQQTRGSRSSANHETRRGWPQLLVSLGVVVLLAVGIAIMLRPVEHVQKDIYPVEYRDAILESCERHSVSPYLVCAIIKCESNWREDAVSGAGAVGLMQIMPSTATSLVGLGYVDEAAFPSANLIDPVINIEYGCATLDFLQRQLHTAEEVIAAYNAGLGTIQTWLATPEVTSFRESITYPETLAYLDRVLDALYNYQLLYDANLNEVA